MKFKSGSRRKALEYEKDLVVYWKKHKIFEKSVEQRPKDGAYVFYDGPPFITGVPHHGTLLSSVVKDAIPRFWAMQGKRVERVWGWDCHGLPAEVFTEKKLGIQDKRDIGTKITLEEYIMTCRDNMVQTGDLWESTIDRIGRWVDFKGAYKTMDKEYMESVWWAFKTLHEKGKIYEGEKVLLYCTRDATPISKAEVAMDNSYQVVTDPSVYVKFKLPIEEVGEDTLKLKLPVYLLAWTTTPWTLNANTAIAVNKNIEYSEIRVGQEIFIIATNLVKKVLTDDKHKPLEFELLKRFKGEKLVGKSYEPLFVDRGVNAHKVWHASFVTDIDGTGIAHEAPAYGEDDYLLAKSNDVPLVLDTDEEGSYIEGPWKGKQIWQSNKDIAKDLKEKGVVWKIDYIQHEYPHCHRCGTKLQYRAHPSWFMEIDGQRTEMLEQNADINWFPDHVKHGRFENTVQSAPDWNLSRDRFWATAMPVWKGTNKNDETVVKVIGSYKELEELSGIKLDDYHRPWIDDVTFTMDGIKFSRVDKVLDCWFESGSMPFAQFHYPFENRKKFEQNFPGDFISEYVGQVRAWFYYVHAVNVGIFGQNAFKNVIVTGTMAGNDGRKMSKSYGNYTDPNELMDMYSADALRFLFLSSALMSGEDFSLVDKDVADISRKLSMIWNVYDFFTLYAEVDDWEWNGEIQNPMERTNNVLDLWILSKIHILINDVEKATKKYDLQSATRYIFPFIDELSNWYVRRSRRRFWKSENAQDKNNAYETLHYVLVQLAHVMAPFTPFLAEELYRKLTGDVSVHLNDWPTTNTVDQLVVERMDFAKKVVNEGLSIRAKSNIKVRQPLGSVVVNSVPTCLEGSEQEYETIILEELNVKKVVLNKNADEFAVTVDIKLTKPLIMEGHARELIRSVQTARKKAGFNVEDRIELSIITDSKDLKEAVRLFNRQIMEETLTVDMSSNSLFAFNDKVKINAQDVTISMKAID